MRQAMRTITSEIMRSVAARVEISREIGSIKNKLNLQIKDEKAENDMRILIEKLAVELGLRREFAGRLLNLLLDESETIQSMSRHSETPKKTTHLAVFARARELESAGKNIIHMEVGEPDYGPPLAVGESLSKSFRSGHYHYTETVGITGLRRAIAEKENTTEGKIIVTPGGRFAVYSAISGLLKPGDELVVIEPAWPAYAECAQFIGATVRSLRTTLHDKWSPDISQLEQMVNSSTKMIAINYPNNPTGKILGKDTLQQIISIAEKKNLYLLSDEVYLHYANSPMSSISEFEYPRSIVVQSFSKTYAMTGFRIGYAHAEPAIIASMKKVQSIAITSVAEPIQYAALSAIAEDVESNSKLMKERLDFVSARLKQMNLHFVHPDGAMYVYPALPSGYSDLVLVDRLLEEGVAIAPGSGFGTSYGGFVRISACQPVEVLAKGLDIMSEIIKQR